MRITVDLRALRRINPQAVAAEVTDDVAAELAPVSERQTQQRFAARRAPSGRRWAERKFSQPWPILERTGALRRSIRASGQLSGRTVRGDREGVELQSDAPYAGIVQKTRPFLGWSRRDQGELAATAERFLDRYFDRELS